MHSSSPVVQVSHLEPRPCLAHSHNHTTPSCLQAQSAGHMSRATMLSLQLACLMSTSRASRSGCRPLVTLAHICPGWPCWEGQRHM
jgi:hypothetical protein